MIRHILNHSRDALLVLFAIAPHETVLREQCDLIEVNSFIDESGREVFLQAIYYDWSGEDWRVRDWRLIKHPSQLPARDHSAGDYVATWQDGDRLRQVRATQIRESWTQYDPELEARERLPKEMRRGLRK